MQKMQLVHVKMQLVCVKNVVGTCKNMLVCMKIQLVCVKSVVSTHKNVVKNVSSFQEKKYNFSKFEINKQNVLFICYGLAIFR